MGAPTELGTGFDETRKKIIPRVIHHLATIIHPISASKMERASIFLHIASGILKIGSLEAEKSSFLRRQSESIDD